MEEIARLVHAHSGRLDKTSNSNIHEPSNPYPTLLLPSPPSPSMSRHSTSCPKKQLRQRAVLRLHPRLPPANKAHELPPPADSAPFRDQMDAPGQPFLALPGRDGAGHWPNKAVKLIDGDSLHTFPEASQFDAVVPRFFIDISKNVIDLLSNIHRLLRPGGAWTYVTVLERCSLIHFFSCHFIGIATESRVNVEYTALGWGTLTTLQLSAEKVLQLVDLLGFDVDHTSRKSVHSLYAG